MRTSDVTQLMDLAMGLWFPFVRIMAFLRYVPVLDNSALTVRVRIILSLALAIIITPLIPHPVPHDLLSLNSLILTVEQILWGMLFGLMFQCNFAFFSGLIDAQFWARCVESKSPELTANYC